MLRISLPSIRGASARDVQALFPAVSTFVNEFHAGKPAGQTDGGSSADAAKAPSSSGAGAASAAAAAGAAKAEPKVAKKASKASGNSIKMKETFYASTVPPFSTRVFPSPPLSPPLISWPALPLGPVAASLSLSLAL